MKVNDKEWWNKEFQENWAVGLDGNIQTAYFAQLMLKHLNIQPKGDILDWGCAFGQGVHLLAQYFSDLSVSGYDFSEVAISTAKEKFPGYEFISELPEGRKYNTIITSNMLEHFEDPVAQMKIMLPYATEWFVVMTPYNQKPHTVHPITIKDDTLPFNIDGWSRTYTKIIRPEDKEMCGDDQILMVYRKKQSFKVVGCMLFKNEAGKFLEQSASQLSQICEVSTFTDDHSTDDSTEICAKYGKVYKLEDESFAQEQFARLSMFGHAVDQCDDGDWILCMDADETWEHPERIRDAIQQADDFGKTAVAFRLYDMWDETHYRDDDLWNAHRRYNPFAVKFSAFGQYQWANQPLHCGRLPKTDSKEWFKSSEKYQHWGWSTPELRETKKQRYLAADPDGKYGSLEQYESITDPEPNLVKFCEKKRVLLCAPVRQEEDIFQEYMKSLDNLIIPENVEVTRAFILHNSPNLKRFLNKADVCVEYNTEDEYVKHEAGHDWSAKNLQDITTMKNYLLMNAVSNEYDYYFLVDTDLILQPETLRSLIDADKDIVGEIFWTKWANADMPLPNCWDQDSYSFNPDNLALYKQTGVFPTGMTGACILVKTDVLRQGVNYDPVPNVSFTTFGEDRAFCVRAAARDIPIYIDTQYPATHLYTRALYDEYKRGTKE